MIEFKCSREQKKNEQDLYGTREVEKLASKSGRTRRR